MKIKHKIKNKEKNLILVSNNATNKYNTCKY